MGVFLQNGVLLQVLITVLSRLLLCRPWDMAWLHGVQCLHQSHYGQVSATGTKMSKVVSKCASALAGYGSELALHWPVVALASEEPPSSASEEERAVRRLTTHPVLWPSARDWN